MRLRALAPTPEVRVAIGAWVSPTWRLRTRTLGRYLTASSVFITLILSAISGAVTLSVCKGNLFFSATEGASRTVTAGSVCSGVCASDAHAAHASTGAAARHRVRTSSWGTEAPPQVCSGDGGR